LFIYLPILNIEVLVEKPGSLTQSKTWVRPLVVREEGVTFLSAGPWELAWCRLGGGLQGLDG
jgi:hypothetical protein